MVGASETTIGVVRVKVAAGYILVSRIPASCGCVLPLAFTVVRSTRKDADETCVLAMTDAVPGERSAAPRPCPVDCGAARPCPGCAQRWQGQRSRGRTDEDLEADEHANHSKHEDRRGNSGSPPPPVTLPSRHLLLAWTLPDQIRHRVLSLINCARCEHFAGGVSPSTYASVKVSDVELGI